MRLIASVFVLRPNVRTIGHVGLRYRYIDIKAYQPIDSAATQLLAMCARVGGQIDELSR
jgi:hypothetical protein